jgi:hypothetical protein
VASEPSLGTLPRASVPASNPVDAGRHDACARQSPPRSSCERRGILRLRRRSPLAPSRAAWHAAWRAQQTPSKVPSTTLKAHVTPPFERPKAVRLCLAACVKRAVADCSAGPSAASRDGRLGDVLLTPPTATSVAARSAVVGSLGGSAPAGADQYSRHGWPRVLVEGACTQPLLYAIRVGSSRPGPSSDGCALTHIRPCTHRAICLVGRPRPCCETMSVRECISPYRMSWLLV